MAAVNWARIYNRLFALIDQQGPAYYSGGRFVSAVREVDPFSLNYNQLIEERNAQKKSTSRKDYFYDVLMKFPEPQRYQLIAAILRPLETTHLNEVTAIRGELGGFVPVPQASIPPELWNGDRLSGYLQEIDGRIAAGNFDGAVTLCYSCLEGFFKAFIRKNIPDHAGSTEIIEASKSVKKYLRASLATYPDEAISMVVQIAHTVDRARNGFSESHFDDRAGRWLAIFMRDLVNSVIRLLLHFI
jgi:hypothetical protein